MSNEVLMHIPEETVNAIREFNDDYLADVLRPWDCYKQTWYDNFTTVCRFESNDCLVYVDEDGLNYKVGPIDTDAFDDLMAEFIGANTDDVCLCWRHDYHYGCLIGTKGLSADLLGHLHAQSSGLE